MPQLRFTDKPMLKLAQQESTLSEPSWLLLGLQAIPTAKENLTARKTTLDSASYIKALDKKETELQKLKASIFKEYGHASVHHLFYNCSTTGTAGKYVALKKEELQLEQEIAQIKNSRI